MGVEVRFGEEAEDSFFVEPRFVFSEDEIGELLMELGANSWRLQGNNVQADHCFLHNNSSPTLGVSLESPHMWSCFNPCCQKGRSITSLVMHALGVSKEDAVSWLYTNFPEAEVDKEDIDFSLDHEEDDSRFELSETVLAAYPLTKDGDDYGYKSVDFLDVCTRDQAEDYNLGYDRESDMLVFPVRHSDGVLAGLVGRAMRSGVLQRYHQYDEGKFKKSRCLMGNELPVDPDKPLVVVEGPTDFIYVRSCGWDNVRATMGADFSDEQVELLLEHSADIVTLFDYDEAGRSAHKRMIKKLDGRRRCRAALYPLSAMAAADTACKDPDPRFIPREEMASVILGHKAISFL